MKDVFTVLGSFTDAFPHYPPLNCTVPSMVITLDTSVLPKEDLKII